MLARVVDPLRRLGRFARAHRFAPVVRAGLLVLTGLEATYLVGANAFLSSKQLQSIISADDGTLRLAYDGLWTIVPGRYHVSGLRVAGRTHSTQWQLDIERASFTCNVFSLFRRRFDVSRVDGEGVGFRLRLPETVAEKDAPRNVGEPSIPWYDASDWPPPSDAITPPGERWTIDISGVSVATRELWVDRYRHVGPGRATGKFTLTPSGGFEVGPAKLVVHGGRVWAGEHLVAGDLTADVSCRIGFFPLPIRDNARDVLRVLSTRIIGDAQIADARSLNPVLGDVPDIQVADGSGLATFESLPEGGTRVYLQMGAGDDGDRRTVLARMTDELTQQLAAFKSFAEELARGRQLLAAPSMSGTTLRSGRILDRRRSGAA